MTVNAGVTPKRTSRRLPARVPAVVIWGSVTGVAQAASPLALWWLPPSSVYAFGLIVIASIYIGFAVADGRPKVILVECVVAAVFVAVAAIASTGLPWLVVAGLLAHGLKDLWQHRTQFVRHTRWWPPFCAVIDVVAATILAVLLIVGTGLRA